MHSGHENHSKIILMFRFPLSTPTIQVREPNKADISRVGRGVPLDINHPRWMTGMSRKCPLLTTWRIVKEWEIPHTMGQLSNFPTNVQKKLWYTPVQTRHAKIMYIIIYIYSWFYIP